MLGHVLFDGRHGQCAGGFDDGSGVHKHILDRRAHRVGVDFHEPIDQAVGHAKGLFADELDRCAIGEQAHVGQRHALLGRDRLDHGVGVVHLHTDHLDLGAHGLDEVGHAADQTTTANGHEHSVQRPGVLAQHFHGDRALAGDHVRVVKGVDEGQAVFFLQGHRVLVGVGVAVAEEHHLATELFDGVDLHLRGGGRHDDDRARAELAGAQRHALGVVAGRSANHAFFQLRGREIRHFVVGAAQLEAVHGLLVFALEQDGVVQPLAQLSSHLQGGGHRHVVHAGVQNFDQVVSGAQGAGRFARGGPGCCGGHGFLCVHHKRHPFRAKKNPGGLRHPGYESTP